MRRIVRIVRLARLRFRAAGQETEHDGPATCVHGSARRDQPEY